MIIETTRGGNKAASDIKLVSKLDSAAATAAVLTVAAQEDGKHIAHKITWSYSAAPTGGKLTVTGYGTSLEVDITAGGPGSLDLYYVTATNTALVATLSSGGGAIVGKVNMTYTTEMYA